MAPALLAGACASASTDSSGGGPPSRVTVGDEIVRTSGLALGFTHTQFGPDDHNHPQAVARARSLFADRGFFQNQHLMGWGGENPQPSPGVYDWHSLDDRVELIEQTGGVGVLTLCCAPDWMKGGTPGATDWDLLGQAPDAAHYGDFAKMAADVARRYPSVRHFQVWNGLRGFFDPVEESWDARAYTSLYNQVYQALKRVDPQIRVGGPHVTIDSWTDPPRERVESNISGEWGVLDRRSLEAFMYWWENKLGADFVAVDLAVANRDGSKGGSFEALDKVPAAMGWIDGLADLPVWATWWHSFEDRVSASPARQQALLAATLARMAAAGVDATLLWQPQGEGQQCAGCLWTDTRRPDGGRPSGAYEAFDLMATHFAPGTELVNTRVSSPTTTALASPASILLVNHWPEEQEVLVDDRPVALQPYEVKLIARAGL